jgi:uncharacterized membrane protein YuzA (DUF378 family)
VVRLSDHVLFGFCCVGAGCPFFFRFITVAVVFGVVVAILAVAYLLFSTVALCGFYELCLSAEVCLSLSHLCGW